MSQQSHYWAYAKTIIQIDTCNPKFIAVLFTVARTWKQPRCLSVDEWIKKLWYIYTVDYSVQFSHRVMSDSFRPHELQHSGPPCPSPTPGVHSNSCPSSQWCHPAISSSIVPFSSCPNPSQHQSLFQWVNSLHEVAKVNTQDWSPLEWTGWISLQSKGLSRVFFNTTVQKPQFFGTQLSL